MEHDHTGQLIFCGDAQVSVRYLISSLVSDGSMHYHLGIGLQSNTCRDVYTV